MADGLNELEISWRRLAKPRRVSRKGQESCGAWDKRDGYTVGGGAGHQSSSTYTTRRQDRSRRSRYSDCRRRPSHGQVASAAAAAAAAGVAEGQAAHVEGRGRGKAMGMSSALGTVFSLQTRRTWTGARAYLAKVEHPELQQRDMGERQLGDDGAQMELGDVSTQ